MDCRVSHSDIEMTNIEETGTKNCKIIINILGASVCMETDGK